MTLVQSLPGRQTCFQQVSPSPSDPAAEWVWLYIPSGTWVDEIVIDTISTNESMGPENDDCGDAEPIGDVEDLPFDTCGAAYDGDGICVREPNVWYRYIAPATGHVTMAVSDVSNATSMAIYGNGSCYSDDDWCCEWIEPGEQAECTLDVQAGHQYLIEIGPEDDGCATLGLLTIRGPCWYDLDDSGGVGIGDLAQLLSNYGTTSGAAFSDGDLDGDGDVDLADLSTLLGAYGATC